VRCWIKPVSNESHGFNSVNQTEQNLTAGQKTAVFGSKRCRIVGAC
jgi:hypothetical protein